MTVDEFIGKRRRHLKEVKALANKYLSENKRVKDNHKHRWQSELIENNIKELKNIILRSNKDLVEGELRRYVEDQLAQCAALSRTISIEGESLEAYLTRILYGVEKFSVFTFSPSYAIEYDFYWIPDGNIGEQHSVGTGKEPPSIYEKYLPVRIDCIRNEVIPYLSKKKNTLHVSQLTDILKGFKDASYLTTNILLITLAESMVRVLCKFIYAKQNPWKTMDEVHSYIYEKFNLLETLIQKGDWNDDFPIMIDGMYHVMYNNLDPSAKRIDEQRRRHLAAEAAIKAENQKISTIITRAMNKPEMTNEGAKSIQACLAVIERHSSDLVDKSTPFYISVRTNLQFLMRRYKEDRNSIIHGDYSNFDKGWKTYIYLSAISKIFELIKRYDEIYKADTAGHS